MLSSKAIVSPAVCLHLHPGLRSWPPRALLHLLPRIMQSHHQYVAFCLAGETTVFKYYAESGALDDYIIRACGVQQRAISTASPSAAFFLACHALGFSI